MSSSNHWVAGAIILVASPDHHRIPKNTTTLLRFGRLINETRCENGDRPPQNFYEPRKKTALLSIESRWFNRDPSNAL